MMARNYTKTNNKRTSVSSQSGPQARKIKGPLLQHHIYSLEIFLITQDVQAPMIVSLNVFLLLGSNNGD